MLRGPKASAFNLVIVESIEPAGILIENGIS
jgi:hypothetical protein